MMLTRRLIVAAAPLLPLASLARALTGSASLTPARKTQASIKGPAFHINDRPTYLKRNWEGKRIEGLLLNSRMVQGIFDDDNTETRALWAYPDGPFDADRNTREFVAAMPQWRQHGLLGFTINLQGGSPQGYSRDQPWINSAFDFQTGALKPAYMGRLEQILDEADKLGMVPIVSYFYFGQSHRFVSEQAVLAATDAATDWLLAKRYTNVLVEIANECNVGNHPAVIKPARAHELIVRVQQRSLGQLNTPARRLLVSTSYGGMNIPGDNVVAVADFLLLHGNGVSDPAKIGEMVRRMRALKAYRNQPILFNEDDHFDFDKPVNNFTAAIEAYASWGYFDYRLSGETALEQGYQSVPVDWGIRSDRKRGFFDLVARMTGAG
jgi:hypothetical protein